MRSMSCRDRQLIALAHQSTPLDLMIATSLSELDLRGSVAVPRIIKLKKLNHDNITNNLLKICHIYVIPKSWTSPTVAIVLEE